MTWRAALRQTQPWDRSVRLHVFRRHADGRIDVLKSDGWLQTVEEGAEVEDAGLMIPEEALEAVAEAFAERTPARVARLEGEVAVLRETLKRAESRVELMIDRALEG